MRAILILGLVLSASLVQAQVVSVEWPEVTNASGYRVYVNRAVMYDGRALESPALPLAVGVHDVAVVAYDALGREAALDPTFIVTQGRLCTVAQQPKKLARNLQYAITCEASFVLKKGDTVRVSR